MFQLFWSILKLQCSVIEYFYEKGENSEYICIALFYLSKIEALYLKIVEIGILILAPEITAFVPKLLSCEFFPSLKILLLLSELSLAMTVMPFLWNWLKLSFQRTLSLMYCCVVPIFKAMQLKPKEKTEMSLRLLEEGWVGSKQTQLSRNLSLPFSCHYAAFILHWIYFWKLSLTEACPS